MKYPKFIERFNQATAIISGILIVIIALLCTMEGIVRNVFSRPTFWSLDISQYLLIWAIFLGTAPAFQEKTHVSVDMVKDFIGDHFGLGVKRVVSIIGYLMATVFILVIGWNSIQMINDALELEMLTMYNVQIPVVYLYVAMLIGSVFMLVTVICIIVDVIGGNKKYL